MGMTLSLPWHDRPVPRIAPAVQTHEISSFPSFVQGNPLGGFPPAAIFVTSLSVCVRERYLVNQRYLASLQKAAVFGGLRMGEPPRGGQHRMESGPLIRRGPWDMFLVSMPRHNRLNDGLGLDPTGEVL